MNVQQINGMLEYIPSDQHTKRKPALEYRKRFTAERLIGAPRLVSRSPRDLAVGGEQCRFYNTVYVSRIIDADLERVSVLIHRWDFAGRSQRPYPAAYRASVQVYPSSGRVFVSGFSAKKGRWPWEFSNRTIDLNDDLFGHEETKTLLIETMTKRGILNAADVPLEWSGLACRYPVLQLLSGFGKGKLSIARSDRRRLLKAKNARDALETLSQTRDQSVIEALLEQPDQLRAALLVRDLGSKLPSTTIGALLGTRVIRGCPAEMTERGFWKGLTEQFPLEVILNWLNRLQSEFRQILEYWNALDRSKQPLLLEPHQRDDIEAITAQIKRQGAHLEHCQRIDYWSPRRHPWAQRAFDSRLQPYNLRIVPRHEDPDHRRTPGLLNTIELPSGGYGRLASDEQTMLVFAEAEAALAYHPLQPTPSGALGESRLELCNDLLHLVGSGLHSADFTPGPIRPPNARRDQTAEQQLEERIQHGQMAAEEALNGLPF